MTKKLITLTAVIFTLIATGCSSSSRCDNQRMSLMERFQNRPRPVKDWFSRGSSCNDCNPPAGQMFSDNGFGGDCQSGLCGTEVYDTAPGFFPSGQMNPITTGYPPYSDFGGIGTGTTVPSGNSFPGSTDELEMPPMYGNGR